MKTLFVSDLDGTLLTAKETVSEYSMRLLNELIDEDGVLFTYATARSLNSAAKAVWGLRQNLPVILYNGAIIMEPWNGNKLYNSHFTGTVRADIRRILHEYDVWPLVYSFLGNKERVSWLRGRETEGMKRYLSRRAGDPRLNPVDSPDELKDDEIFYYTYIDAKERTDVLHAVFEKDARFRCIYQQETYQSDYWLEIMPAGTSKGAAATVLKERLGAEKLVAFGDALNDRELFRAADEAYAVENADEELKKVATAVIGYSEEDSVSKFIRDNLKKYH